MLDFQNLACVVMASGLAKRFGSNKLLAIYKSKPLLQHTLEALQTSGLARLVVVTRSQDVVKLCEQLNIEVLLHKEPYQSDTVRLGVQVILRKHSPKGILFATGDQPLLSSTSIKKLCKDYLAQPEKYKAIFRLAANTEANTIKVGNPVIFPPELFKELQGLPQDKGGSYLCKQHLTFYTIVEEKELLDIDTPEDLLELEKL